jgi:hypothetical protein
MSRPVPTTLQLGSSFLGRPLVVAATAIAVAAVIAACSGDGSPSVGDLNDADAPYYYVGRTFDGFEVSDVQQYDAGVAEIVYGTCRASNDEGCAPPLELQHRLCRGQVTVVIFVGQEAKTGSAARAAEALRPLSKGARGREPNVAFDRSPPC